MGSAVAQEMALAHPQRIEALVLIGAFVSGKQNAFIREYLIGEWVDKNWRNQLIQRPGFQWPADAWSLNAYDLSDETMAFLRDGWVTDPIADSSFVKTILSETARVPLGAWIGVIKGLGQWENSEQLKRLTVPTLVLWATQDNAFLQEPDQLSVKMALEAAAAYSGARMVYKTYGKIPLPDSGMQENDLGHNLHWGAPQPVAADIASFFRYGLPQFGLPYADISGPKKVRIAAATGNITVWEGQVDIKN
jgi:pimeloyl-ACP methyl ester carboxylesterase